MSTKYFIALSLVAIAIIVGYRYEQYFIERNFPIVAAVSCDPQTQACFVADCSPEEDEECDTTPYLKAEILASEAPACLVEHTCESFSCSTDSCTITECSEESLEEGEVCSAADEEEAGMADTDPEEDSETPEL